MVMSSQRCVTPQPRKAAMENSRPARTASASMFSVWVVIIGERAQPGASGDRTQLPPVRPAISAAALSHWQPALVLPSGRPINVFEGTGTWAFFPHTSGYIGHRFAPGMWVAGLWLFAVTSADPLVLRGAGRRPHRRDQGLMSDLGGVVGAISAMVRGHQGHHDGRCFPVLQRDGVGRPEPRAALLAFGACQPPQPVESPPGRERAGPDVGLTKRCRVGVVRDALCQLAPHDRYPELVANYSSLRGAGTWSSAVAGGNRSGHRRKSPGWRGGERSGWHGRRRSGGYGWGSDLPHWLAIARCPVAGRAAAGPGVAVTGVAVPGVAVPGFTVPGVAVPVVAVPGVAVLVAQLGYPGAHFMSADIRWRDLDIHKQTFTVLHELGQAASRHTNGQVNMLGLDRPPTGTLRVPRQRPRGQIAAVPSGWPAVATRLAFPGHGLARGKSRARLPRNGTGSNTGAGRPQSKGTVMTASPPSCARAHPLAPRSHTPAIRLQMYIHTVNFWYISSSGTYRLWLVTAFALYTGYGSCFPR